MFAGLKFFLVYGKCVHIQDENDGNFLFSYDKIRPLQQKKWCQQCHVRFN